MAKVHVSNVVVLNNPCEFNTPFQFEITFECIEELKEGKMLLLSITFHLELSHKNILLVIPLVILASPPKIKKSQ